MHKDLTRFRFKKGGKQRKIIKDSEPFLNDVSSLEGITKVEIGRFILKGNELEKAVYKIKSYDGHCLRMEGFYKAGKQKFKL